MGVPSYCAIMEQAASDEHPRLDTLGHSPEQAYFNLNGAEVNAFNFNFTMTFSEQVGAELPVDGGLSISLMRTYNSGAFKKKSWQCKNLCSQSQEPDPPPRSYTYNSYPRQNPMGLGWEFHLGHIYQKARTACVPPSASSTVGLCCTSPSAAEPQPNTRM